MSAMFDERVERAVAAFCDARPELRGRSPRPSRVLMLGLDGATFDHLEPWLAAGRLPTLSGLLARGTGGVLRSTIVPISSLAWSAAVGGRNPGKMGGIFGFVRRKPGSYNTAPVDATMKKHGEVWDVANAAGLTCVSVNVPITYPPKQIRGVFVSGWDAPVEGTFTHPAALSDALRAAGYPYLVKKDSAIDDYDRSTDLQFAVASALLDTVAWDLATVVFDHTDTICHFHGHEEETLRVFFEGIDRRLARLLSLLTPNDWVFVLSDHGSATYRRQVNLNRWLMERGYLHSTAVSWKRTLVQRLVDSPGLKTLLGPYLRFRIKSRMRVDLDREVDWGATKAYVTEFTGGNFGAVRLNLKGREPQGIVSPGAEAETVVDRLLADVKELRDPKTGRAAVVRSWRRRDIYWGEDVGLLPEVIVEYEEGVLPTARMFDWERPVFEDYDGLHVADHTMRGMYVLAGPQSVRGLRQEASIQDAAPTLLYLAGVAIPSEMDGRVMEHAILPEMLRTHPASRSTGQGTEGTTSACSATEAEEIAERLRSLGYI